MRDNAKSAPGTTLDHVAALIEQTKDPGFDSSQGAWVCGDHGIPECDHGSCADLVWPQPNGDPVLAAFTDWADREFLRVVGPYDKGLVPEMPDAAFRSYTVWEWPLGALLEAVCPPAQTS